MLDSAASTERVHVPSVGLMVDLLGAQDRHLRAVETAFPEATIVARGTEVLFSGDPAAAASARTVIRELLLLVQQGTTLEEDGVLRVIEMVNEDVPSPSEILSESLPVSRGKVIRPKTQGQRAYIDAIRDNTLVFSVGPAGTGKTYLAMAAAVEALTTGAVRRMILTRPAVEAGERLGFLPGDLEAKINPYLRPLYDALYDMMGPDEVARALERGDIEIAPLAYMRGRTLNDAIVILDEAQNTSRAQMKMFLTRLGFNSNMIITGDVTQVDLPQDKVSGLDDARRVLRNVADVAIVHLTSADVVRHRIVASVIEAYEAVEEKRKRR